MKEKYQIKGMRCASCQAHVLQAVEKIPGISHVEVNLLTGTMTLDREETVCQSSAVLRAVSKLGFQIDLEVNLKAPGKMPEPEDGVWSQLAGIIISAIFLLPLLWLSIGNFLFLPVPKAMSSGSGAMLNALTQLMLFLPILYLNRGYFTRGIKAMLRFRSNMDTLIALGAGAGFIFGLFMLFETAYYIGQGNPDMALDRRCCLHWESSAMILILVSVGKMLEAMAKRRTGNAIRKLLRLVPATAIAERNGKETEIPASKLRLGDVAVLRAGASIPADGVLLTGPVYVDQSILTGESLPVEKTEGDSVSAGTVIVNGFGKLRVEELGEDTAIAKIAALVESAGISRAPMARIADQVSAIFVPVVLLIAIGTFMAYLLNGAPIYTALSCAMGVLLISCPCALGLATPVAVMVGTGKAAGAGCLFRDASTMETLQKIDTILFDKTGTLTENKPVIAECRVAAGVEEREFAGFACGLEKLSQHPLAKAVYTHLQPKTDREVVLTGLQILSGEGLRGNWNEQTIYGGNARLMNRIGIAGGQDFSDGVTLTEKGHTVIFFAKEKQLLGWIALHDPVTRNASLAVGELRGLGLRPMLVTGDNEGAAKEAGKQLGMDSEDVYAGLMPGGKEKVIEDLQAEKHRVAMVGDGINDAPALIRADAGIAVGTGTDIAIESADLILMKNDLMGIGSAIRLSRAVVRNIRINLFWAFIYNVIGIPLAAFGILNPVFCALAMSLSSICVVGNSLRLRKFRMTASGD